jgi:hypothetical protein
MELARKIRNKAPGHTVGAEQISDMLKKLAGNYTPGHTPVEAWHTPPLLWWVERPEYVEAMQKVLGEEIKPFMEQYWVARLAWLTPDSDSPAAMLKQLQQEVDDLRVGVQKTGEKARTPTVVWTGNKWSIVDDKTGKEIAQFDVLPKAFPVPGDGIIIDGNYYEVVRRDWTIGSTVPVVRVWKMNGQD